MSESVEEKLDIFKTDHSTQYINQVVFEDGTEHIICVYPRFWKEKRYLLYDDKKNHYMVHCIPQNSKVKLPKQLVKCMNEDNLKKIRRSSGTDVVEDERKNLDAVRVDSFDEIKHLISGVYHFEKFRDQKKKASKDIEAQYSSSTHGTFLLTHERFLKEIESLSRELRRTYSERIEEFGSIRGRLTNRGMLRLVTHPSSRFECRFDDFFVQAPIYRIVSKCLGIVVSSYNQSLFPWLNEQFTENRTKAVRILFAFNEVEPYETIQAIKALRKFIRHPPREFRKFHPISNLMMEILLQEERSLANRGELKQRTIHLGYSNLIWEDYLERCIKELTASVKPQTEYDPAWKEVGGKKRADLSVNHGKILVDAKYTEKKNAAKAQYQHQMFYYMMAEIAKNKLSHGPECIVLAYPVSEHHFHHKEEVFELGGQFEEMFAKFGINPTKLIRLGVPIPDQSRLNGSHTVEEVIKNMVNTFKEPFELMAGKNDRSENLDE